MGAVKIKDNLYWVGVQDPDLRVFDVVMRTEFGTSYNSFILKTAAGPVLFETAKAKHFDTFLANIKSVCNPAEIAYIVIDHTEPDHAGSLEKLLDYAPQAKVLASPIALRFLADICNRPLPSQPVSDNQVLHLGDVSLRFLSVPFLHWPDSIYTYVPEMATLFTCDSFGCHYADDRVCNDLIEGDFTPAYRYYFEMIMGPFKRHVRYALDRIRNLPLSCICTGHGPVLRQNIPHYLDLYAKWSQEAEREVRTRPKVVVAYASAYGYSERLAREIIAGLGEEVDAEVLLKDMVTAEHKAVLAEMRTADGLLFGSSTINGDALPPIMDLAMALNGVVDGGKVAGVFGSFGWSGEGPEMLMARLRLSRMKTVEPALRIPFNPQCPDKLAQARHYGRRFGRKLKEEWVKLQTTDGSGRTFWKCTVCGEVFEGALPPARCAVCGAGAEAFVEYTPETVVFRRDAPLRVAIVGAGAGGIAAAEAVRKRNAQAQIDVYSSEPLLPYYRPVLTKTLAEKVTEAEVLMHPANFYTDQRITLHLGTQVARIAADSKSLTLADGTEAGYDKLVLATGARCFIPPVQGVNLPGVLALREKSDFDALLQLLTGAVKNVVVIGGGLLGLETAWALRRLGHAVTVVEACPIILPRQMDAGGAPLLEKIIEASGVILKRGVYMEEICGEQHVTGVKTKCTQLIPADVVIISAGIRSNTDLARAAGLTVERGIVVDANMRSSQPDIYAVGDCASFNNRTDGIWETALEQGRVAGAHIAGDTPVYSPKVFGATLNAFGTHLFAIGDLGRDVAGAQYQCLAALDELHQTYRRIWFRDGKMTGGVLLGDVSLTNPLLTGVTRQFDSDTAVENGMHV